MLACCCVAQMGAAALFVAACLLSYLFLVVGEYAALLL